jgi:hypothetical protein
LSGVRYLLPIRTDTLRVQHGIHYVCAGHDAAGQVRIGRGPGCLKLSEASALALRTRTVTGGQGGRLVQEEQVRVLAGCHDDPSPAPELQHAVDPAAAAEEPADPLLVIVQAAAVPQERAAVLRGDQFAERGDTILSGHGTRATGG